MSVPHPILSLKAALRAGLLADAAVSAALGTAIYDAPPRGEAPPYLMLGDGIARENGTNDADGRIIDLELVIVTSERGSSQALTLAGVVEERLPLLALAPDGHRLVTLILRETLVRQDVANSLTRAILRLRAFTETL